VDSRGYVWICTNDGLSRFDGKVFTTYGLEHGLPSLWVNDIAETETDYFIATARGLSRMPKHGPSVASAPIGTPDQRDAFSVLLRDRRGTIWVWHAAGTPPADPGGGR
jgi:ligand-binding sensor domain-containing protein